MATPLTTEIDRWADPQSVLAAQLAMRAMRDDLPCLATAIANMQRLHLAIQPGARLLLSVSVEQSHAHRTLMRHASMLTGYAEAARSPDRVDVRIDARPPTIVTQITRARPLTTGPSAGTGHCVTCDDRSPSPTAELPLTIITGQRRGPGSGPDECGAMRNDLRPLLESGWANVRSIPFADLDRCGPALRSAIDATCKPDQQPGILLIVRGGSLDSPAYRSIYRQVGPSLAAAEARGWCVGAALGHSHPRQGEILKLPWTEDTPALARERLLTYRTKIRARAELLRHLEVAYTSHMSHPDGHSDDAQDRPRAREAEYLDVAQKLAETEAGLPTALVRTLRYREASSDAVATQRVGAA